MLAALQKAYGDLMVAKTDGLCMILFMGTTRILRQGLDPFFPHPMLKRMSANTWLLFSICSRTVSVRNHCWIKNSEC